MSEEIYQLQSEICMLISKVKMLEQQIDEKVSKTDLNAELECYSKISMNKDRICIEASRINIK